MKKFFILLFVLSISVVLYAQDMTGTAEENWCNPGGPLEGKCTIPGDVALTNYMWELGWYLAAVDRYEVALEDIPDRFINQDAPFDKDTADMDSGGADYNCKPITLPSLPGSAVSVTGELVYAGVTYQSVTIPSATYATFAAGEEYDPEIIGDKHKVKLVAKDAGGNTVKSKTWKFKCPGDFDPTAGGIIPSP